MSNFFARHLTLSTNHPRIGEQFRLKIQSELCCERCGKIIHNHFDCPICEEEYTSSDAYGELEPDFDEYITCDKCGARFQFLTPERYGNNLTEFMGIAVKKD